MSLLDIHVLGSPILRQDTTRVEHITPELRRLVDDMFETMEVAKGVGLAAPQAVVHLVHKEARVVKCKELLGLHTGQERTQHAH